MSSKRYLSAKEAADRLQISVSTLYAYVSRGLIRSEQAAKGKRERRYYAEDIEKLLARKAGRRNPEKLARDALHWGAPVMDSAITLIDGGKVYYRGWDVATLTQERSVEDVASLIWTGEIEQATTLFDLDVHISAQKYETLLLHMDVDGAALTPIQELQAFLPAAAADDPMAYNLHPATVAVAGARILRLMASIAAGDVPEDRSLASMLSYGWCNGDSSAEQVLNAALIVAADHELNASSFAARVVASAGASPYQVVMAGLSALQGIKHGGHTERVTALINEARSAEQIGDVLARRLRQGDTIPGFGHILYDVDPRAQVLFEMLDTHYGDNADVRFIRELVDNTSTMIGQAPTIDVALVAVAQALKLPAGSALTLFALGRTIGWIGHAIEQYETDRLIRPRARYTGEHPHD